MQHNVKSQLAQADVLVEEYGGEVPVVEISALKGTGLEHLEEAIVSLAELADLKAPIDGPVSATVLEVQTRRGLG